MADEASRQASKELTQRVIEQLRQGSTLPEELFRQIVDLHRPEVLAFFRRHGLPAELAEDLAQEVFIKAMRALPTFRGDSALKTWIYRIAVNLLRDQLRRRSRSREVPLEQDPDPATQRAGDVSVDDPVEGLQRQQLGEAVRQEVARLPAQQRVAVAPHLQGCPPAEIAAVMDKAVPAVRMLLSRARRGLRQPLQAVADRFGLP